MSAMTEIGYAKAIGFAVGEIQKALLKIAWLPQIRGFLLSVYGAKIGSETVVLNANFVNVYRTGFKGLTIGKNCFIGDGCLFDLAGPIKLGNHVTLSQRVCINTHTNVGYQNHALQQKFPAFTKPVVIESHCFVGLNSTILAGTHIHEHSLVGAASLVKGEVPTGSVMAGNPATPISADSKKS